MTSDDLCLMLVATLGILAILSKTAIIKSSVSAIKQSAAQFPMLRAITLPSEGKSVTQYKENYIQNKGTNILHDV